MVSDLGQPWTRGEGGQKRANFWVCPLWMAPYTANQVKFHIAGEFVFVFADKVGRFQLSGM